jgi:hypothetical protein
MNHGKNKITAVEFMNKMDLKKNTFYKIMKDYEAVRHSNSVFLN